MSQPLSQSEAFTLMEEFFRGGLKGSEFYRSKNMSEWQFYKWKQLYLDAHPSVKPAGSRLEKEPSRLLPVNIIGSPSCMTPRFEIVYPGGVTLRIGEVKVDIQLLKALVNL